MSQWEGKSKGTPLGYRIVIFVCTNFGLLPAYAILRLVAFYFFLFHTTSSRISYRYFRDHVGYGPVLSRYKVYRNYYVFAQTLLDKMIVMGDIENRFTYNFDGEENLREMVHAGKGGILLSAHVGNWEIAGHLLKRLQTRVNVVMFDAEHEKVKAYLESITGERNLNIIPIKDDLSHVYAISEALQKNELVCLHADRFTEGMKTVAKKFLKGNARFPEGPFALAASFQVPVSLVFALKENIFHYHFYGSTLIQKQADEDKKQFAVRLMNLFVAATEQKVRQYPEQWFNYYNFWE